MQSGIVIIDKWVKNCDLKWNFTSSNATAVFGIPLWPDKLCYIYTYNLK